MYSDLVREVNASYPTIMGVWGHTVTGFGYSTTEQMVAIHNSNSPAIDNWHIDEFWQLAQIHPRPKAGCAINIIHPDGGQGWIDNGPDFETYLAGSIMEISWIGDFLPNTTVEILISPVSTYGVDDQWYEIAAAAPNTGSYSWQIPQHWQGEDYRIVLQVLDAEGNILGVDGSYGSFTIIPGGGDSGSNHR
ncbi:MAG: hypothetical protein LRZ88_07845 [Candidatus Cloacimonetes bacterium]|nr:hypothetical protein [Candidatus Cloacimonadota bacterium]